jgi:hypothetical protein
MAGRRHAIMRMPDAAILKFMEGMFKARAAKSGRSLAGRRSREAGRGMERFGDIVIQNSALAQTF